MPIFIIILALLAIKYPKVIKERFSMIMIISIILSAIAFFITDMSLPINSGELGMALLILVMFQGAFKKGSTISRHLLMVRMEYSILGFIFIIPHSILYMFGDYQTLEWNGILSFLIMIPLFITSFMYIRKKMQPKHWRALHLASYPAYALMFAHVIYVGDLASKIVYSAIALTYMILKIKNSQFSKLNKPVYKGVGVAFMAILLMVNVFIYNLEPESDLSADNSTDIEVTTFKDGIYYGEATGFKNMKVKIDVTVSDNVMTEIDIKNYGATGPNRGMDFEAAVDQVKEVILSSQSTNVDVVSGATYSTKGLINAVSNALSDAELASSN